MVFLTRRDTHKTHMRERLLLMAGLTLATAKRGASIWGVIVKKRSYFLSRVNLYFYFYFRSLFCRIILIQDCSVN